MDHVEVPDTVQEALADLLEVQFALGQFAEKYGPRALGSESKAIRASAEALKRTVSAIQAALAAPVAEASAGVPSALAVTLLSAASKSGDPGALELAAQLADAQPCARCGYVKQRCRCLGASSPMQLCETRDECAVRGCAYKAALASQTVAQPKDPL